MVSWSIYGIFFRGARDKAHAAASPRAVHIFPKFPTSSVFRSFTSFVRQSRAFVLRRLRLLGVFIRTLWQDPQIEMSPSNVFVHADFVSSSRSCCDEPSKRDVDAIVELDTLLSKISPDIFSRLVQMPRIADDMDSLPPPSRYARRNRKISLNNISSHSEIFLQSDEAR
jgi:hypothetical protein